MTKITQLEWATQYDIWVGGRAPFANLDSRINLDDVWETMRALLEYRARTNSRTIGYDHHDTDNIAKELGLV